MLCSGDISPGHCDLLRIFDNPNEPQDTDITQLLSKQALSEADEKIKDIGGLVNPGTHSKNSADDNFIHARTTIDFDIAISAGSENSGAGEAKAKIWVIEASAGGKKLSKNEVVSRLSFSVDVVLPAPKDQKSRVGMVRRPNK